MNPTNILKENKNWVVIGISDDKEKYSYKIYQKLKELNKNVYGVNPKYDIIDNDKIYHNLGEINTNIDVVVMVVNPNIGLNYIREVALKKIPIMWLQPETESEEIRIKAKENDISLVEACVLVISNYIK